MDTRDPKTNASSTNSELGRHQRVLDAYRAHAGSDPLPPPARRQCCFSSIERDLGQRRSGQSARSRGSRRTGRRDIPAATRAGLFCGRSYECRSATRARGPASRSGAGIDCARCERTANAQPARESSSRGEHSLSARVRAKGRQLIGCRPKSLPGSKIDEAGTDRDAARYSDGEVCDPVPVYIAGNVGVSVRLIAVQLSSDAGEGAGTDV